MTDKQQFSMMRWLKGMMLKYMHNMITCAEFEDFINAYLEGTLPPAQLKVFELHLKICRECRDYLAAYQRSMELGQAVLGEADEALPADVPEDLVRAVLDASRR